MQDENQESSEETAAIPSGEESESQPESTGNEEQEASSSKKTESENIPLNDPKNPYFERFSELTYQNREFKGRLSEYDQNFRQLQQQLADLKAAQAPAPKAEPAYKSLMDQLESVNPEFAKFQRDLLEKADRAGLAEKLQQRLDQMETRDFQAKAVSRFNTLLETNKVPAELKDRYNREVRALAYDMESQGKKLGVDDVDTLFKTVHDDYSKFLEDIRRKERASYVQAKKGDSTPAPATGGAAVTTGAKKIAAGDEESLVKWLANEMRTAKKL